MGSGGVQTLAFRLAAARSIAEPAAAIRTRPSLRGETPDWYGRAAGNWAEILLDSRYQKRLHQRSNVNLKVLPEIAP